MSDEKIISKGLLYNTVKIVAYSAMVVGVLMAMRKNRGRPDLFDAAVVMSAGAAGIKLIAPDLELSYN